MFTLYWSVKTSLPSRYSYAGTLPVDHKAQNDAEKIFLPVDHVFREIKRRVGIFGEVYLAMDLSHVREVSIVGLLWF